MKHRCPDQTTTTLVRDAAPVGQMAPMRCPRCGYAFDPSQLPAVRKMLLGKVR